MGQADGLPLTLAKMSGQPKKVMEESPLVWVPSDKSHDWFKQVLFPVGLIEGRSQWKTSGIKKKRHYILSG